MAEVSYPLSAQDMVYDYDMHMYVMTYEYVKQVTGADLYQMIRDPFIVNKTQAVNRALKRISQDIYSFIYSYNEDNDYQEYVMAHSPRFRENLKQAILCQLDYIFRNGNIRMYIGLNMDYSSQTAKHDLEDIRGKRSIDPDALVYIERPVENGIKLCYSGKYYYSPYQVRVGY